ncbi:MFS transporter [Rhizosphaericola mali]|uniref:MFS transporter n=1 Tax=Rhizosphaericola mali TaxID=2545455 RepID=A0A5P2GBE8_9BACT|nr:MFS transporter [Rhizosphaericola mali]
MIKIKEKVAYGLGDAASSMFWKIFSMYLFFFYTDVFGLAAAAVGTMFLVTKVWDSLFDPFVGILSDRLDTKWGKFRPFLLWVAIPFAVIGAMTFYKPDFAHSGKLVYAYITYSLMMMVYSLINVPYASLLGVMSSDGKMRTTLASYRMVFAFAGSLIALWAIEPLVKTMGDGTLTSSHGWFYTIIIFGVVTTLLFWGCFAGTKERIKPIAENKTELKEDIADLLANKPWWILLGAGVATLLFNTIRDGGAIYYFKYFVGESDANNAHIFGMTMSLTSLYLVIGQAANIVGVVSATPISNKLGKKRTFFLAMLVAAFLSIVFYFIPKDNVTMLVLLQFLISICAGAIFPLLWSMYADTADYSEWKQGRRATGLVFSASSMSQKLGWALGGALTGWLLSYFGFKANSIQNSSALIGIRWMLSFLPAAGALLSMAFIFFYPLTENKLENITSELNIKRQSNQQ